MGTGTDDNGPQTPNNPVFVFDFVELSLFQIAQGGKVITSLTASR
jgi:hypothetical protein